MPLPFVLDMETSDPDDFLTLLLLLGHPAVDLRAVTVTPGTREQVGLVRRALAWFDRADIAVGALRIDHPKRCVSAWHYTAYGLEPVEAEPDDEGWRILDRTLGADTTLVTGAALSNLGRLLSEPPGDRPLGRLYVQGGFAGEGVVPPERQLEKFRGLSRCPSFNLNGDPKSVLRVLDARSRFSDLRFVSKNVCHGVIYDAALHARVRTAQPTTDAHARSLARIVQGMDAYLAKRREGKAFHDPLAACCAIDPSIAEWADVEIDRAQGGWGSRLAPESGVRIIVGYTHERFVETLLGQSAASDRRGRP